MKFRMPPCQPKSKQSGFSVIEVLLSVLIVAALAATGSVVYQHHKPSSGKNSAATSQTQTTMQQQSTANTSSRTAESYAGWKSYTSPAEKFTFKYPSDWTIHTNASAVGGNVKEAVYLTGPNNFQLSYTLAKVDPNAVTPANRAKNDNGPYAYDPNSNVYNAATALGIKGLNKILYIVIDQSIINGNQPVQAIGLAENKAYTEQTYINPLYYMAKNVSGYEVQWYGAYAQPQGGPVALSYGDFVAKPEVAKAKLILQSISY